MDPEVIELEASCPREVALRTPMAKQIRRSTKPGHWLVTMWKGRLITTTAAPCDCALLPPLVENITQAPRPYGENLVENAIQTAVAMVAPHPIETELALRECIREMQDALITQPFKITDYLEISAQ